MRIPIYQVDAFASRLFAGNPAAVCPLDRWLPDSLLQSIAAENNLAETAFYVREGDCYRLRWFTPEVEVELCGHATLATAFVMSELTHEAAGPRINFMTRSGALGVDRDGDLYALDFPSRPPEPCSIPSGLIEGLGGAQPDKVLATRDHYVCIYQGEDDILKIAPKFEKLSALERFGVIVTSPGRDCDFVSRFFAPSKGVPEDPVTGSAHCALIPYWANQLSRTKLFARQKSRRGGELWCEFLGERVRIAGHSRKFLEGTINIDFS